MVTDVIVVDLEAPPPRPVRHRSVHAAPVPGGRAVPNTIVIGPRHDERHLVGEVLLTIAATLGVVVMLATALAAHSGLRPLVVRSGSMEPAIATGSMVLVRRMPASQIRRGDIVSVERPGGMRVTHRVVTADHAPATAVLILKGDANEDPDPSPVTVTSAERVVFSAPGFGRMLAWPATPGGGFAVGCALTAAAFLVLRRRSGPLLGAESGACRAAT